MARESNSVNIYDDETDEFLGEISPSGGRLETIEKLCTGYKPGTVKIMQVAWPGYHTINIFISGKKLGDSWWRTILNK